MPRSRFVWREGMGVVEKHLAPPLVTRMARAPGIHAPGLIRDSMDPIPHPCTGVLMDSKAAFRAVTRAHGCEEMGNDSPVIPADPGAERAYSDELRRDIGEAMQTSEHRPADRVADVLGGDVTVAGDGWA